jgi:predicted esterase
MYPKRQLTSFLLIAVTLLIHSRAVAQASEAYNFVRADWHLAGISEYHNDWQAAIEYYQKVIRECMPLPLDIREWYRGTAYYGIARCECRYGKDSAAVRIALSKAFSHHFWNFALTATDSELMSNCGHPWLDSLSRVWNNILSEERPLWPEQAPIVLYPDGYDSSAHWPLIIALHGGNANYESFAEDWLGMANALKAVIVIPPGIIRESQITNTWGADMSLLEKPITDLVSRFTSKHLADPSHVYLAGFSQGAEASMELAVLRPGVFRGAIAMSGFVDRTISDSILYTARDSGVRIYVISGEDEVPTFREEIDTFQSHCSKSGIPFKMEIVPGMIHEVPLDFHTQMLQAWAWLRPVSQASRQGARSNEPSDAK